jgi:hypothetical protein
MVFRFVHDAPALAVPLFWVVLQLSRNRFRDRDFATPWRVRRKLWHLAPQLITDDLSSKRSQELHQILLLRSRQFRAQDQIEEFDRVLQSQEPAVMQIRRRILHAA